jgi:hypothetical protein
MRCLHMLSPTSRSILYVNCHPGVSPPKLEQDHDGFNPGVVVLELCRAQ